MGLPCFVGIYDSPYFKKGTREMNNEPVAIRYDFDGYGYQYMDSGSGNDWQTRVDGELLYANPVKELTREDRLKLIGTLKWAEDLLREAGHDEAVDEVQDCLMILRKAQEK